MNEHTNLPARAAALRHALQLQPHPEGGFFREVFRSAQQVAPGDGRGPRSGLTHIDFLLAQGQFSAWHRVASDEVWQLFEGGPLRLWLMPPTLDRIDCVDLGQVDRHGAAPRHAVPMHWWQAAEPLADFAYCGATVGPGFDFADFAFMRADALVTAALSRLQADLARLL